MKLDRLPEIVVRAVRYGWLSEEVMRETACHDPEVITLTLDLLNCRHALECLVSIMFVKRCRLELSAQLLMHPIEQEFGGGMDLLQMHRKLTILVREKMDIVAPRHSKPRAGIRSQQDCRRNADCRN
jgi:hypothetical protein